MANLINALAGHVATNPLVIGTVSAAVGGAAMKAAPYIMGHLHMVDERFSLLSRYSEDMTEKAQKTPFKHAYGREDQMAHLLAQDHGLVMIVGAPGTGKTALMEEAAMTYEGRVLKLNVRDLFLSESFADLLQNMVKGGGAESKLQEILNDLERLIQTKTTQQGGKPLLFIDEVEFLIKSHPYIFDKFLDRLDRQIVIIGMTTNKQLIETWRASSTHPDGLARRIDVMELPEFTPEQTIDILRQDRERLQNFTPTKPVRVEDSALETASWLASEYKKDGHYPHHAIELIQGAIKLATIRGKTSVTSTEVAEYLETRKQGIKTDAFLRIAATKQQNTKAEQNFENKFFPAMKSTESKNSELVKAGDRISGFFTRGKKGVVITGSSDEMRQEVAQTFWQKENATAAIRELARIRTISQDPGAVQAAMWRAVSAKKVICLSVQKLVDIANATSWGLTEIKKVLGKLKRESAILFIEDAHLLLSALTPEESSSITRSIANQVEERVTALKDQVASQVASSFQPFVQRLQTAANTFGVDIGMPAVAQHAQVLPESPAKPTAVPTGPVVAELIKILKDKEFDYILSVPSTFSRQLLREENIVEIPSFNFFEMQEWLTQKTNAPEALVRKVLYVVSSLRLTTADHTDPLDVSYQILSKTTSNAEALIAKMAFLSSFRDSQIREAWEKEEQLNRTLFVTPALNHTSSREVSIALDTFLGGNDPILCLEGARFQRHRSWVEKQIASHLNDQDEARAFLVLDLDALKDLPPHLQQAQFKEKLKELPEGAVLGFKEEDFRESFVREAFQSLVSKYKLIVFSSKETASSQGPGFVEQAVGHVVKQAVGQVVVQATEAMQNLIQSAQATKKPESNFLSTLNKPIMTQGLTSFTKNSVKDFVSSILPKDGEQTAPLTRFYTALYGQLELDSEKLGQELERDAAYFAKNSNASVVEYLASKHRLSKNEVAYAINPRTTPFTYRISRIFGDVIWSFGGGLIQPLKWANKYVSTLSMASMAFGGIRMIVSRYWKF